MEKVCVLEATAVVESDPLKNQGETELLFTNCYVMAIGETDLLFSE